MARDSLESLRAVRRRSVEEARYALGACLTAEAQARRDRAAYQAAEHSHQFLEVFVCGVRASDAKRLAAEAALTAAQARSAEARAVVVAARMAAEAVETLNVERA